MRTHSATTQPVTASPCLAHTSGSALPDLQARKAALTAPQRLLMCLCTAFSVALGAGAAVSDMLHAAGDTCAESKESAAEQAGALAVKMSSAGGAPRRQYTSAPFVCAMRRVARALLRATSGPAGVPTSTAGWPSVSCRSFAGAAPRRSGGDWALSAVERSAAALQGLNVADDGEEEEEEEDESPLFYGSADGRDNSSTSRRLHEQREAEEEAASARMHGLRVVQSTLLFPPSAEALANLPELARLVRLAARSATCSCVLTRSRRGVADRAAGRACISRRPG